MLGEAPTLALMRGEGSDDEGGAEDVGQWWNPFARPPALATSLPQRLEPRQGQWQVWWQVPKWRERERRRTAL